MRVEIQLQMIRMSFDDQYILSVRYAMSFQTKIFENSGVSGVIKYLLYKSFNNGVINYVNKIEKMFCTSMAFTILIYTSIISCTRIRI